MAVDVLFNIEGRTGRIFESFFLTDVNFSDLFAGTPLYYPGSTIQVQEIITVNTRIVTEHYVSADLRWYRPKRRLGSYQYGYGFQEDASDSSQEGFLDYTNQKIVEYSEYTVTANPRTPVGVWEQIALDNCNAYLIPEVYVFPGDVTPDPGFRYYDLNPLFLGAMTISPAPLADTRFFRKLSGIALFLYPGVEAVSLRYQIAIINDIYTDYARATPPTCEFLRPGCDAQFSAFLLSSPFYFSTLAEAIAAFPDSGGAALQSTFVSATDPTCIRTYYIVPNN